MSCMVGDRSYPARKTLAEDHGLERTHLLVLNTFSLNWSLVHDLVLGNRLVLVESLRATPCRLSLDDRDLHVLDLDPHQQEVDLANDHVLQVVLRLVVFELNVQAFLDPHFHLDWVVHLRVGGQSVYSQVELLGHVGQPANDGHPQEVPQSDVGPSVCLIWLLLLES